MRDRAEDGRAENEHDRGDDDKQEEQDLRDSRCRSRDESKTKDRCDERDDEKNSCPLQHLIAPYVFPTARGGRLFVEKRQPKIPHPLEAK